MANKQKLIDDTVEQTEMIKAYLGGVDEALDILAGLIARMKELPASPLDDEVVLLEHSAQQLSSKWDDAYTAAIELEEATEGMVA